jgi:imidazolonepropionase-like amidohydrolase
MPDHLIPKGVLVMEDGRIRAYGEERKVRIPEGCRIVDAKGLYVGPGFVDIHSHAGGGSSFEY